MEITYIYHSGFLVETAECYYLFDYYKGTLPPLHSEKPIFVFVSHSHEDHYAPAVFELLSSMGMKAVAAVFPNDIKRRRYPAGWTLLEDCFADSGKTAGKICSAGDDRQSGKVSSADGGKEAENGCTDMAALCGHILKVYHSSEYVLPCRTRIKTFLSTDSGVAYLLSCPEGNFFHAGDLNDWISEDMTESERRRMTGSYRASLRGLAGVSLDAACLPLDPHLGSHYADGLLYFLKTVDTKKVYPMHFWDRPEIIAQFVREHPEYAEIIQQP